MNTPITSRSSLPVWRRRAAWLVLILALAVLCLAAIPPALSGEGTAASGEARLEGSWLVTVTLGIPDGPPPFEVLQTYTSGGELIGSQTSSPGWLWTPWHGSWTKTGRREFVLTAIAFCHDSTVEPAAVYKIILKETVVIGPDGDTYDSTSSIQEWFGPDGYYEAPVDRGDKTHGVRIKAE